MSVLSDLGFVKKDNQSSKMFESFCPDFQVVSCKSPSDYVTKLWSAYTALPKRGTANSNNTNGAIFELILATLLWREGILPLFLQAKVIFVPNCSFDLLLYSKEVGPICLSAKTSLRERYKQADLESTALKYVHRKSLSFLITLDVDAANGVKKKIQSGDVMGINECHVATDASFNNLITQLKQYVFEQPGKIDIIHATYTISK